MLALMAYEVRSGRMPLTTLGYSILLFVVVPVYGILHVTVDTRAAIYAAVVLPTLACLAAKLYLPSRRRDLSGAFLHRQPRGDEVAL
jgi:hypothetical protein